MGRITAGLVAFLGAGALLLGLGPASAAPGDLDPSFGDAGIVRTAIGGAAIANAVVLQSDGRIVVTGRSDPEGLAVARYRPDGTLDTTFGTNGVAAGLTTGTALGVALQLDGRIVVAGRSSNDHYAFTLVRYTSDGRLDGSFGADGVATGPVGDARSVAIQPNGRIVVAGLGPDPQNADVSIFTLARFTSAGALDPTFGEGGRHSAGRDQAIKLTLVEGGSFIDDINPHLTAIRCLARHPKADQDRPLSPH